ncbi:MAG: GNAT family N-acetyltransferase [Dehalococcoidales bacterium]|nr:GNAT family N-acetyltransferase [Dehalococcoidales bacterium]
MFEMDGLVKIEKNLVRPASVTVARAFMDDPETVYLIPDEKKRENLHHAFEFFISISQLGNEEAYTTSPACEGVALWSSSEHRMPFWAVLSANPFPSFRCGWRFIFCQMEANRIAENIKTKYAPVRHMYLALLGVDPSHQWKGFASALIKPMLKKLDESRLAAYLETQNMKNVSMYEHFGFKLVYHTEVLNGNSHIYAMLRDAR